jgi:glucokinase
MDIYRDERIVLTLDAGGTNFIFNAYRGGKPLLEGLRKDANAHDLELCLDTIKSGFREVSEQLPQKASAISFAFPGPADYRKGIIGDLPNLPAFSGGVPLGSILEFEFSLPVFINNDGDLFAYGEALGGILPEINARLESGGSEKRYRNLFGFTLGTGFGGGMVSNGQLIVGDNSIAAEVWLFSNRYNQDANSEDLVSTRSIQRVYAAEAGLAYPNDLKPKDIFDIATGAKEGRQDAALSAYKQTGKAMGDVIANIMTLTDGIVVIGGGITGAKDLYMPAVMEQLRSVYRPSNVTELHRLIQQVFNLDDEGESEEFYKNYSKTIAIPGTEKTIAYDPVPRLAVATSRIGASESISLGAYAFALKSIS